MEVLVDLPEAKMQICRVHVDELIEQDVNAQVMPREMFNQMTSNVLSRGALESIPFCAKTDKGLEIVSGHHRVRSARTAAATNPALAYLIILLDVSGLSRDEILAKQLAHNNIAGFSDLSIMRRIYLEIADSQARVEAYVSPKVLDLKDPEPLQISDVKFNFDFKHVKLMFLPHQLDDFERCLEILEGVEDRIILTDIDSYEPFIKAMLAVARKENIVSVGSAVARMSEITLEYLKTQEPPPVPTSARVQIPSPSAPGTPTPEEQQETPT